ncbi:MAG: bifunctional diguanylate cyclase/phosphodiesterase [Armatimonadota bacterium]
MTVRARTLLTIGATLFGLIVILFIGAGLFLVRSLAQFEEQQTRVELLHAEEALRNEIRNLGSLADAWTIDGAFSDRQTAIPRLDYATMADQRLNLVLFVDLKQQPRVALKYDRHKQAGSPLPTAMVHSIRRQQALFGTADRRQGREGILRVPNGLLIVAARPVLGGNGAVEGTLILGRSLDQQAVRGLSRSTRQQLSVYRLDAPLPGDVRQAVDQLKSGQPFYVAPLTANDIAGYLLVKDVSNTPVGVMHLQRLRGLHSRGQYGVRYFVISLLLIGLVLGGLVMLVLEKQVLSPLSRLCATVLRIGDAGDLSARLAVQGKDELARLSHAVNGMLGALETSQEELRKKEALRESEERYRSLVELSPEAVFIVRDDRFVFANATGVSMLGASCPEDLIGQPLQGALYPESREVIELRLQRLDEQEWLPTEECFLRLDGMVVDVEMTVVPFTYQDQPALQIVARDITEQKRDRERLNYLAYYDPLTSLPNRQLFNDRLTQALALAGRRQEQVTVVVLDIDRFKEINDTLGHQVGDCLLQEVALRLRGCLRESDTIARIGGDEFFLALPNTKDTQGAETAAQKILATFTEPFTVDMHEMYISASLGLSIYPMDGATVEALVKNADTAMYRAKAGGRNTFAIYCQEMGACMTERRTLENHLRKAIDRDELAVYYQPKVNLHTGQVMGMEALVRWHSEELGTVPPMLFIPLAEETGLIEPIGEYVLRTACAQNRVFELTNCPRLQVAVNLSVVQFQQTMLVDTIKRVLRETSLPPHLLELEITESVAMQNIEHTISLLRNLDDLGVSIAIDDFGTGYSSFSYLTKLPIHTLKIDRSFIQDILHDRDDAAVVAAIIAMTHSLRRRVVAEAVETEAQVAFLREHHCDEAQGFLFGRPVPPEELMPLVDRINTSVAIPA